MADVLVASNLLPLTHRCLMCVLVFNQKWNKKAGGEGSDPAAAAGPGGASPTGATPGTPVASSDPSSAVGAAGVVVATPAVASSVASQDPFYSVLIIVGCVVFLYYRCCCLWFVLFMDNGLMCI